MSIYRRDSRSVDQFKKDIKECSHLERELMILYVTFLNEKAGEALYSFEDHGVDNSGEFIEDNSKITCKADFVLKTKGKRDKKIDIKFCRESHSRFHLKVNQLKKYLAEDVCIVNWMGIDTPDRAFCIITPKQIEQLLATEKPVRMWYKECLRLNCKDFKWIKK